MLSGLFWSIIYTIPEINICATQNVTKLPIVLKMVPNSTRKDIGKFLIYDARISRAKETYSGWIGYFL